MYRSGHGYDCRVGPSSPWDDSGGPCAGCFRVVHGQVRLQWGASADGGAGAWLPGLVAREQGLIRVESIDGKPIFVSDGVRAWDFTGRSDRPLVGSPDRVIYLGPSQFLLRRRTVAEWAGNDFAQPAGEVEVTEFAGRDCWAVQLAPPEGKPYPLRTWVDVESGQMLGYRVDEVGEGSQFVDLTVGETLDEELFVWEGPAVTQEERQQLLREEHRAAQREQAQWFTNNVSGAALTVRVPVNFTSDDIRFVDSGGSYASNRAAMLSRRPRSTQGWQPKWGVPHYVWSTHSGTGQQGRSMPIWTEPRSKNSDNACIPASLWTRDRRIDPPGSGRI